MAMKLPSHQISAFLELAKTKNFSKAADKLGVTQSALSQRVSNLESDLETTLLIRGTNGLQLTPAGELLLRYCQTAESLEDELLGKLKSSSPALSGVIRVAGFSSVMRSMIIPSLASFLRANPQVTCEFKSYEVDELFEVLKSSKADLIVTDHCLKKSGVIEHALGKEEYVVIESAKYKTPADLYLDHGPFDTATEDFFRAQGGTPKNYRRSFMGDVYGIINGVEEGLGRAVMSKHLIKKNSKVKIIPGYKKFSKTVSLNYFDQSFYSALHKAVVQELQEQALQHLA